MKKLINTGRTKRVLFFIKKIEYYCDFCGKKLDKNNHRKSWVVIGTGEKKDGCKNNKKCNPFYED